MRTGCLGQKREWDGKAKQRKNGVGPNQAEQFIFFMASSCKVFTCLTIRPSWLEAAAVSA